MSTLSQPASLLRTPSEGTGSQIVPFWQRLHAFFLFPLQMEPLIYGAVLALASYVLMMPFFLAVPGLLMIVLASSRYAFKVAALASRGVIDSNDYRGHMMEPEWKSLPWALFGVLIVHVLVIGFLASRNSWLGLAASLTSSLVLPATIMVLIQSGRIGPALNPLEVVATMFDIGKHYWLLCLFLFLLQMGIPQALEVLLPITPRALLLPAAMFTLNYFTWVMAALIGYVMFQHHGALQIDLLKQPEATGTPTPTVRPEVAEAKRRDTEVAGMVRRGDLSQAIAESREWVRTTTNSASDHRRLHRVLLLDDPASGRLAEHSPQYIALLLAERRSAEALDVIDAVRAKLPDFAVNDAGSVVALARHAWKQLDAARTLNLLRSFDRRFPNAPEIPVAYELIIRVLKQGLQRSDQALPIYQALQRRYPDHPATQEAAWVLRDELHQQAGTA